MNPAQNETHCRELWATVLIEAVRTKKTRSFLNGGGNFPWICEQLGLNEEYTLRKIKETLDNPKAKEFYLIRGK